MTPKPHILYLYDPLCGFTNIARPEIEKFYQKTYRTFPWEITHGRIFTDNFKPRVDKAWQKKIQDIDFTRGPQMTGQKPSKAYWKLVTQPNYRIDSTLSSLAFTTVHRFHPEKLFLFAMAFQSAVYDQGKNPTHLKTVLSVIATLGLDPSVFAKKIPLKITDTLARRATRKAQRLLKRIGVVYSVPHLILFHGKKLVKLDAMSSTNSMKYVRTLP